jgi:hypothetical protein
LEREVARAGLTGDPLGPVLLAFLRGVREVRAAAERVREPVTPEDRREAARLMAREAAGQLARLRPWLVGTGLALAFIAGAGGVSVAWWLAPVQTNAGPLAPAVVRFLQNNPGLAASLADCRAVGDHNGRTVCGLTYWRDGSPAPGRGQP